MFGLLFFGFVGICGILSAIRLGWMDMQVYKEQSKDPDENFKDYWMNASGTYIHRQTGEKCFRKKHLGHDCLISCKDLRIIKDYTEEKNERVKELVIGSNDDRITAYKWIPMYKDLDEKFTDFPIKGMRAVDKKTGNIYVVRRFKVPRRETAESRRSYSDSYIFGCDFYMSIENGHLIRLSDGFIYEKYNKLSVEDKEDIEKFIEEFNNKQDIDIQNKGTNGFIDHFYFNDNKSFDLRLDAIYHEENLYPKESIYSH